MPRKRDERRPGGGGVGVGVGIVPKGAGDFVPPLLHNGAISMDLL